MCFFPSRIWVLVAGSAFIPVAVTYIFFSAITFQSLQITKSHISTLYPEDQSTLCIVALSGPRHPPQFLMLYLQNLHSCSCVKSSANKLKGPQREAAVKGTLKMGFFVNLNLFPTLIGTLTAAVGVINKTIQLERWVLALPTTDRTVALPCESWSRKWIVISFYDHKRLL